MSASTVPFTKRLAARIGRHFSLAGHNLGDDRFVSRDVAIAEFQRHLLAFSGARPSRSDPNFTGDSRGINGLNDEFGDDLLRRVRFLQHSNAVVRGFAEKLRTSVLRTGLWVKPTTPWPDVNAALADVWLKACEAVDPASQMRSEDYDALFLRELAIAGEVFEAHGVVREDDGRLRATSEMVIRERLPMWHHGLGSVPMVAANGNEIRQSIEVDKSGRRVAYYVLPKPPNDTWMGGFSLQAERVPAGRLRHTYCVEVPGQHRGISWLVAAIMSLREDDAFIDAAMWLARAALGQGVIVKGVQPGVRSAVAPGSQVNPQQGVATGLVDALGKMVNAVLPASVTYLTNKDADVTTVGGNLPPPQMQMASDVLLSRVAMSLGRSFEGLTGNYKRSSYSSARMGALQDNASDRAIQRMLMDKSVLPRYAHVVRTAMLDKRLDRWLTASVLRDIEANPRLLTRCTPEFPGAEWVDPTKESQMHEMQLAMGVQSKSGLATLLGRDYDVVLRERIAEEKQERELRREAGLPQNAASPQGGPSQPGEDEEEDETEDGDEEGDGGDGEDDVDENASGRKGSR